MASELTRRVAVAAVGIPFALGLLYVGGWPLAVVLALIAAGAAAEMYRLAVPRGTQAFVPAGAALAGLTVIAAAAAGTPAAAAAWLWPLFVVATLLVATAAIFLRGVARAPLATSAITVFTALFTGGTLAYAVFLRELPVAGAAASARLTGAALLAFPLVLTWLSDTSAYFGGRRFGRRKLIPSVSPAKTVEGAISGVAGAALAGALYGHFVFSVWLGLPLGAVAGALAGLLISPVAQLGDLAESLLKREAGVKDSGALLPGHGGLLDRFDSLFFSIPVAYWLLSLLLRGSAL
jgi:phosphatidate cytidylyltransferase